MTLKSKVIIILISIFILSGILNYGIQRFIVFPNFLSFEREESIKNVFRCVNAIQREIQHLDFLCFDWAVWDDTYEFIKTRSDSYIKANLPKSTFTGNNINAIFYLDTKGKIIWRGIYINEDKLNIDIPALPKDSFPMNHPLISHKFDSMPLKDVKISGIYMTSMGPMLVSSRPILTSEEKGPVQGFLIMGRFLNESIIKALIEQTQTDFKILPVKEGSLGESEENFSRQLTDKNKYISNVRNEQYIDSYARMYNINGETAFIIKTINFREISKKGYTTLRYATYSILAAGIAVMILILLFLHYSILDPISKFTKRVITIGKTGDLSSKISLNRKDELGLLSNEFDGMLEHLKEFNEKLELKVKERTIELSNSNINLHKEIKERKQAEEDKRKSEEKLARSKRMESLGLMAGGIAHDLNNILAGIVSYPDLLLLKLPKKSPLKKTVNLIKESGLRAADVVSELLTVARGVKAVKEVKNLNTIVKEFLASAEFLKIQSQYPLINLTTQLNLDALKIFCSSIHIEKSLLNLIVNAYESVKESGNILISTQNCYLDKPLKGYQDIKKGEYALLSITDNGRGISEKDISKIFEPFYSKKVMGRSGTGLGLTIVWNAIASHDGYINMESNKDRTVFTLYIPITKEETSKERERHLYEDYIGNGESVLIIDDENLPRSVASEILSNLGYLTKSVSSGEEAIEYIKNNPVDIILLDMIMPKGMSGAETYKAILEISPHQKAIIVSGFSENSDIRAVHELGVKKYIQKPYTIEKIGIAVKEELKT